MDATRRSGTENTIVEETNEDILEANSTSDNSVTVCNENDYKLEKKESSDYDTDLEIEAEKQEFDGTGKTSYLETCNKISTTPISYFLRHLNDPKVSLRYHGIGSQGAIALASALFTNTMIIDVDLYENYIGPKGVKAIAAMMKENCYIMNLNLGRNMLQENGCKAVGEMLQVNMCLRSLDLSSNHMGDKVGDHLAEAIRANYKLTWLNLSDNDLGENVGIALGPAINSNDALEHLDLSWNQIRGKGAQDVAAGLWSNCTLSHLNLSWNGFGNVGALALAEALSANNTLTELDISCNRIGTDGATLLAKGIQRNNTLEILKMDGNPITSKGAFTILTAVDAMAETSIRQLHFRGIFVDEDFENLYKEVKESKKIEVFAEFRQLNVFEKLLNLIAEDKDKWVDEFEQVDVEHAFRVPKDVFFDTVESFGLHLSLEEKLALSAKLKSDRYGNILYKDIMLGFPRNPAVTTRRNSNG